MDRLQRKRGLMWAEGWRERERLMTTHAKQMSREQLKCENWKTKKKGCVWRVALTSVHAYSTCWHRHTRLPEASFLGLSVKPYIHTADEEKEGEKQREIIQLDSMQKQQYGKAHLHHVVYWTQNMKRQRETRSKVWAFWSGDDTPSWPVFLSSCWRE